MWGIDSNSGQGDDRRSLFSKFTDSVHVRMFMVYITIPKKNFLVDHIELIDS